MTVSSRIVLGLSLLCTSVALSLSSVAGNAAPPRPETFPVSSTQIVEGPGADPIAMTFHNGNYYMMANYEAGTGDVDFPIRKAPSIEQLADAPLQSIRGPGGDLFTHADLPVEVREGTGWQPAYMLRWRASPSEPYRWYYVTEGGQTKPKDPNDPNCADPNSPDCPKELRLRPYVLESEADDPMGPYHFKAALVPPPGFAYQPAAFQVGDQLYQTMTNGPTLYIAKMPTPFEPNPTWRVLETADTCWEGRKSACPNPNDPAIINRPIVEGASVVVRGDKVVLLYAANGWELPAYTTGMLTTSVANIHQLDNPAVWTHSPNPVFSSNPSASVYGPGNVTLFKSPDQTEDWIIYHVKTSTVHSDNRVLQYKKVTWNPDNTPNLGAPFDIDTYPAALPSGDPGRVSSYEAEQATVTQAAVQSSATASGRSYVAGISTPQSSVTFTVNATQQGIYPVRVWFTNPSGSTAQHNLAINGDTAEVVSYPGGGLSGRFPIAQYQIVSALLHAGSNQLKFSFASGSVQLDRLQVDLNRTGDGMVAVSRSATANDLFVIDSAHRLRSRSWTSSGGWGPWSTPAQQPAAGLVGIPGAAVRGTRVELAAIGRDGNVWTSWLDPQAHPWTSIGKPGPGVTLTGAAVASPSADSFSVFALGADRQIWQRKYTAATGWSPWSVPVAARGTRFVSAPAAISRKANYIDVFATAADGIVRLARWDLADTTRPWWGWFQIGAPGDVAATSAPSVATRASEDMDLVARGADNRIWHRRHYWLVGFSTNRWVPGPADPVPGSPTTGIAATSRPGLNPWNVDIFARSGIDVFSTNGNGNPPTWSPWTGVGAPDENPVINPGWATPTSEVSPGTVTVQVPMTLSAPTGRTVTVTYAPFTGNVGPDWASYPADYEVGTGTLTFLPGEVTKTVTVTIKADALDELDETALVGLSNPVNATIGGFGVGGVTILDDDPEPVINPGWAADTAEGNSGTRTVQVPMTLSAPSGKTITVAYGPFTANVGPDWASYPADYEVGTGTLTFLPGETTKTVTVTIKADTLDELNETALVGLTNATNATIGGYTVGGVRILDDD